MVAKRDEVDWDSPVRREVLADIARRQKITEGYISKIDRDRRNLDFARGSYVHIARLYDQIDEHQKADEARRAAANLGKGLRKYFQDRENVKTYDLTEEFSGIASAIAVALGSLFLTPQFTGNFIGSSGTEMSFIGLLLFVCGLLGLYGFARRKK